MKATGKHFALTLVLSLSLWVPALVHPHTMWLNVSDYSPHPEAGTIVYFGWGHRYPVDGFLSGESLDSFVLVCAGDGEQRQLNPNPGGFLATEVTFQESGAYLIAASQKPGFYTMHVENGKIHHKLGPKTGLKGVILSLYYEQYAKALVNVGGGYGNTFSKPVGHRIEIIPLKNPSDLRVGDRLPIQVLFEGKPLRFSNVFATYAGFSTGEDFAYATSTDGEGKATIRLLHYGPWLIKTDIKLPVSSDLKDKCNQLHYTATLTFEVP